ncbi:HAD-like superfamily [Sesbania bispinosa]|nr:HAD-like superfamily [Sesbania bispinosa]
MEGKNKSYKSCIKFSDSEDDYDDVQHPETELDLSLEKLNLGPRKKLLIMNLNGFLLCRFNIRDKKGIPKSRRADGKYANTLVYKRPFSEEFMEFCLEKFEVGIWSSAIERNVDYALDFAIGKMKSKLIKLNVLILGFKSLENKFKPLFFKELNEVWDTVKKGGPYSASNALLIDDKPYKAFLNPPNTGIFPVPYKPEDKNDKALDPKGELCLYLEGLADANDVLSYVKDNPFGQLAITSSHPDWDFYSEVRAILGK